MEKVGKEGVITVEEAKVMETTLEVVEGMQFDRGYVSPYFVTDTGAMEAVLTDAYILITEKKLSSLADLVPLLEKVVQSQRPILIIAEEIEGGARRPGRQQDPRRAESCRGEGSRASATGARRCSRTSPR